MNRLNVSVEEYTTPNPVIAGEETSVDELDAMMKEYGIRHVPIVRGDEVVGVVSERDLKVVAGLALHEKLLVRASDIMASDPVTVSAEASFESHPKAINAMTRFLKALHSRAPLTVDAVSVIGSTESSPSGFFKTPIVLCFFSVPKEQGLHG